MNRSRVVIGFYAKRQHADEAIKNVQKEGLGRTGVLNRTDNHVRKSPAIFPLPGAWTDYLVRVLLPSEWLVVVKCPSQRSREVLAALGCPDALSIFAFPFERPPRALPVPSPEEGVSAPEKLRPLAAELAAIHSTFHSSNKLGPDLLRPLRESEKTLEEAAIELSQARQQQTGIPGAGELLLDNAHVIRSHIADIRHNLPRPYRKILPTLEGPSGAHRHMRIYDLAKELISSSGLRLNRASITDFLDAYQSAGTPLTIAELWYSP